MFNGAGGDLTQDVETVSNLVRNDAARAKAEPTKEPQKVVSLEPKDLCLESAELELEALKELPGYTERIYSEAVYVGQMKDGQRHGKGAMKYKNGRQYEGSWLNDLRDGKGFERYANNNTYFG